MSYSFSWLDTWVGELDSLLQLEDLSSAKLMIGTLLGCHICRYTPSGQERQLAELHTLYYVEVTVAGTLVEALIGPASVATYLALQDSSP